MPLMYKTPTPTVARLLRAALVGMLTGISLGHGPTIAQTSSLTATDPVVIAHHQDDWHDGPDERDGVSYSEDEDPGGDPTSGGRVNRVLLNNRKDARLRVRGNVQLNRITGPNVAPINFSYGYSSCVDCQTVTVALQINLIQRGAPLVAPQNVAVAVNESCTNCRTVAHAVQYVISVDDPSQVPEDVNQLIWRMDRALQEIHSNKDIGLAEAETRVDSVISEFIELGASLARVREEATVPTSPSIPPPEPPAGPLLPSVSPTPTSDPAIVPEPTPAETAPLPSSPLEPSVAPPTPPAPTPAPMVPATPTT